MDQPDTPDSGENLYTPDGVNYDEIVAEFAQVFSEEQQATTEEITQSPEEESPRSESAQAETASEQPEVQAESEQQPATESGLATRLAQAAKAERERIAEKKAWEEAKAKELEDSKAALVQELINNPLGFIKKYGVPENAYDVIGANFYAAALGDDTPDAIKQKISGSSIEMRLAQLEEQNKQLENRLREEMQSQQQAAESKATLAKYQGFLSNVPEDLPYLKATDSSEAIQAMAEVADHIWVSEGRIPEAKEVATLIEQQLAKTVSRYQGLFSNTTSIEEKPQAAALPDTKQVTLSETFSSDRIPPVAPSEEERIKEVTAMLEAQLREDGF